MRRFLSKKRRRLSQRILSKRRRRLSQRILSKRRRRLSQRILSRKMFVIYCEDFSVNRLMSLLQIWRL